MSYDPRTQSTLAERIAEAERELGMRQRVYKRAVFQGHMREDEAARNMQLQEGIIKDLEFLAQITERSLFNQTPVDDAGVYGQNVQEV